MTTHQFEPIHTPILLCERPEVSIFHELRHDFVLFVTRLRYHCCTKEWKDIRVVEVFPYDHLLAKPL